MNNEDLTKNEEFKKASSISYYEKDLNKYVDLPVSSEEAIKNPKEYRKKIKENYQQIGNMFNDEYINKYMDQMNDLMKDVKNINGK
ncbi:MAG: hypothetical protein IJS56_06675 [Bacilli bacterium]|nr:hypothetical protein [Bacilli bacterium]